MSGQACEQLTFSLGDSPANPSPWLESKRVKGMIDTSGRRCSELSESCARIALSVRTYLESSRLPPGKWSRIWSVLAITSSCLILRLRVSERGTDGQGCFSLRPTPNTMDALPPKTPEALLREATATRAGRKQPCNLRDWVAVQEGQSLWPTPTARDCKGVNSMEHLTQPKTPGNNHHVRQLANAVKLFTTPCAADAQGSHGGNNHRSLRTDIAGQLNPTWVEWLMGFPPGWTDLNASEML
nr:MAG TPA: hypothetical protein [Caudoviricetes sp.]